MYVNTFAKKGRPTHRGQVVKLRHQTPQGQPVTEFENPCILSQLGIKD